MFSLTEHSIPAQSKAIGAASTVIVINESGIVAD
jgi:hypothetical protein